MSESWWIGVPFLLLVAAQNRKAHQVDGGVRL
jgi:hypothetical protein